MSCLVIWGMSKWFFSLISLDENDGKKVDELTGNVGKTITITNMHVCIS